MASASGSPTMASSRIRNKILQSRSINRYILPRQFATNFPFCSDGMVTFGRAIRLGQMSTYTDDFEKLVGRKPMTVKEIFEHMEEHLIGSRTSTED